MKVHKMFSIDQELIEELKTINASKVVNDMLNEYFNKGLGLKKEEIRAKIENKLIEKGKIDKYLKELNTQLTDIKIREKDLKQAFKNIPKAIIQDFNAFPNMTETVLLSRWKEIYSKEHTDLTLKEVKEAYNKHFENKE